MHRQAVYERIGGKIRRAREMRELNQVDVARALGLTRTAVSNIETGRQGIQVHQLLVIADVLDVSAKELLDIDWTNLRERTPRELSSDLPENLAAVVSKFQNRSAR